MTPQILEAQIVSSSQTTVQEEGLKKVFPRTNRPTSPLPPAVGTETFERSLNGKPKKGAIGGAYEWLLERPMVLAVMWLAGTALINLFVAGVLLLVQLL